MPRSLVFASLILSLTTTTHGQATCEGGSCAANQEDVTNLMQFKSQISRHGGGLETEEELEAWQAKESKDDGEIDIKDLALHQDFLIIARKMAGQHVAEEEMDGFFSRSKMFFKEPLSAERGAEYCWKRTEARGVGTIPKACPSGTEKGQFASWLPICYKSGKALKECPAGWRNDGLYCRLPEYGRGIGHFTKSGCEGSALAKKTKKGCHKPASSPLIWYPVCKENYDNFGCCICRPTTVTDDTCKKEFGAGSHRIMGSSCYRTIDWSTLEPHYAKCETHVPDLNAGLCYRNCTDSSFHGVGPVCWESAVSGVAVSCGMALAKNDKVCADATSDQIFGVTKLALNLATLGGAGPAVAAVTKTVEGVEVAYATISDAIGQLEEVAAGKKVDAAVAVDMVTRLELGKTYLGGLKEIAEAESAADAIRGAAKFGAQFDPTGIAQVVGAFTYDKCPGATGLRR